MHVLVYVTLLLRLEHDMALDGFFLSCFLVSFPLKATEDIRSCSRSTAYLKVEMRRISPLGSRSCCTRSCPIQTDATECDIYGPFSLFLFLFVIIVQALDIGLTYTGKGTT
jgi:hypothetical protein